VISRHFPDIFERFDNLPDKRKRTEYSMAEIITGALFMFVFKETSRNAYNNDRREAIFRKNFYRCFRMNLPHADAFEDVLRELGPLQFEILKAHLVSALIEQRVFRKFRLFKKFHLVAVDATGMATFQQRHCNQ
jgi:hypothetical protein